MSYIDWYYTVFNDSPVDNISSFVYIVAWYTTFWVGEGVAIIQQKMAPFTDAYCVSMPQFVNIGREESNHFIFRSPLHDVIISTLTGCSIDINDNFYRNFSWIASQYRTDFNECVLKSRRLSLSHLFPIQVSYIMFVWGPNLVSIISAAVLEINSAGISAGTLLNTKRVLICLMNERRLWISIGSIIRAALNIH